jgi:hypothetical protein
LTEPDQQPEQAAASESPSERPKRKSGMVRASIQLLGFGIGVALLIWCVRVVMSDDNKAALEKLQQATSGQIMALLSIAALSIMLNGYIFWATIKPLHKLRLSDTIAVNALATFLSYLPFKISVLTRWVLHYRRDGVPTLTVGTWFIVVAALTVVTVAPMWLAFARPDGVGHAWWLVIAAAIALAHLMGWQAARLLRGDRGMARMKRLGLPEGLARKEWFQRLHGGASMAADGHAIWSTTVARVLDIASFGLRFWIAAKVLGVPLTAEEGLLIGLAYFVVGVVSPFGTVGTREAGALAMAVGAGVVSADAEQDALLTGILLVSVTEAAVGLIGAGFALAWLRADKLLLSRLDRG